MATDYHTNVHALGVDVGGTHLCSAVIDIAAGTLCTEPLRTPVDSNASASEIVKAWASNVRSSLSLFGGEVAGIGFAFPGPFDYDRGVSLIRGVCKYESVYGLKIRESLLPPAGIESIPCRFVNDASAFALGEALHGAAKGADRVVALTLGTGVGSGFVADGKLVTSGEGVPENGWVYCLPFGDSIADDAFSTRWIVKRYGELTGQRVAGAREVAERFAQDEAARQLFDEYGTRLAEFLLPVLSAFGSRSVVLGGNISRAYNLFSASLERTLAGCGMPVDVKVSSLMDNAAMIGAASLFL